MSIVTEEDAREAALLTQRAKDLVIASAMLMNSLTIDGEAELSPWGRIIQISVQQLQLMPGFAENINFIQLSNIPFKTFTMTQIVVDLIDELYLVFARLEDLGIDWNFQPQLADPNAVAALWNEHHPDHHFPAASIEQLQKTKSDLKDPKKKQELMKRLKPPLPMMAMSPPMPPRRP